MLLIHPPLAKPCEPPAGIARLAGTLEDLPLSIVDANLEAVLHILQGSIGADDTWTRRSKKNLQANLNYLRKNHTWEIDRYTRAVMDINRLLETSMKSAGVKATLSNYQAQGHSPLKSGDLMLAAEMPEKNPFYPYFKDRFIMDENGLIGISLNFLSQAITTFAMIGLLKKQYPGVEDNSWRRACNILDEKTGMEKSILRSCG